MDGELLMLAARTMETYSRSRGHQIKGSDSLIRYVTKIVKNGERMVNIEHKESREAAGVLQQAGGEHS